MSHGQHYTWHLNTTHAHTHARTHARNAHTTIYSCLDFVWDNPGELVPESTFRHLLNFLVQMKITQTATPSRLIGATVYHPHHFYARCPSWHNPPNLSWLGTGTKYAGLHTQWLVYLNTMVVYIQICLFLIVWTVLCLQCMYVLSCDFLGARPDIVSCCSWKFEDTNSFINNVNDVCAKTSQISSTTLRYTETGVWENQRR